ncbi:MAG: lipid II flippase MurJ, partial [Acidimicrobiia bacterium]|nr:lipid II flippase MurJ [Acidimicrobiia bacterium]
RAFGQFGPDGTTAGLQYARRLMMLPVGVVAQAAGVAAYPFLAGLAARGDDAGMRSTVDRSLRSSLVISVPVTIVVVLLAPVWVRLALQWGAFEADDTRVVAPLLAIYSLAIPFWVMHQVITRAFYARRKMWTPVVVGTTITAITVPALFLGAGDGAAIASISASAVAAYAVAITLVWYRSVPGHDRVVMSRFAMRFVMAVGAAVVVGGLSLRVSAVLATVLATAAFVGGGAAMGIDEIPALVRKLRPR